MIASLSNHWTQATAFVPVGTDCISACWSPRYWRYCFTFTSSEDQSKELDVCSLRITCKGTFPVRQGGGDSVSVARRQSEDWWVRRVQVGWFRFSVKQTVSNCMDCRKGAKPLRVGCTLRSPPISPALPTWTCFFCCIWTPGLPWGHGGPVPDENTRIAENRASHTPQSPSKVPYFSPLKGTHFP